MVPRLDQERDTGAAGADVAIHTEIDWFVQQQQRGGLAPMVGPAIDALPDSAVIDENIALVGVEPLAVSYNTDLVKEAPTAEDAYQLVLDPAFRGKVGIPDAVSVPAMAYFDWLRSAHGDDYLPELAAQEPRIYDSSTPLVQAVASGEIAMAVYSLQSTVEDVAASGAPIKFVLTAPAVGNPFYAASLRWAHHPNAARVFVDWLMSEEGQKSAWGTGLGASPTGVEGSQDIGQVAPLHLTSFSEENKRLAEANFNELFR
jgi:iron(III) transport system substrate-binding protein